MQAHSNNKISGEESLALDLEYIEPALTTVVPRAQELIDIDTGEITSIEHAQEVSKRARELVSAIGDGVMSPELLCGDLIIRERPTGPETPASKRAKGCTLRQGGHAPGHLRNDFCDALEAYRLCNNDDEDSAKITSRLNELCGKLWNCADILPSGVRFEMEMIGLEPETTTNTFAGAARLIRAHIANS